MMFTFGEVYAILFPQFSYIKNSFFDSTSQSKMVLGYVKTFHGAKSTPYDNVLSALRFPFLTDEVCYIHSFVCSVFGVCLVWFISKIKK